MSAEAVCVKRELEDESCASVEAPQLMDPVLVKEEPEFQPESEELCVKEEPSSELYADHVVKDELVLGPERPHRPTGNYVVQDESSFPALERVPSHGETASAGHETRTQAIDTNTLQGSADTSVYICDNCGHLYKQKHELIRHIKQHLQHKSTTSRKDPKIDKKICNICDRKFKTSYGLKRHSSVHTGERPYSCEICKKRFKSRGALKNHLRTHSPQNRERPFSCDICEKRFLQSAHLTSHIRSHTGERPYSCEICKKKFTSSRNLKIHELTHTTVRPYSCDICGKDFKQLYILNVHKQIHTREKLYYCDICKKEFLIKRHLTKHKETHIQRSYSCVFCGMEFAHRSNLKSHVWIHSKDRSLESINM